MVRVGDDPELRARDGEWRLGLLRRQHGGGGPKSTQNPFAILFDRRYFLFVPAVVFALPQLIFTLPPTENSQQSFFKSLTLWAFAQLFRAVPWSHGTLGFLVAAELQVKNTTTPTHDTRYYNLYIKPPSPRLLLFFVRSFSSSKSSALDSKRSLLFLVKTSTPNHFPGCPHQIVPSKPWVRLEYHPCHTKPDTLEYFERASNDPEGDFVVRKTKPDHILCSPMEFLEPVWHFRRLPLK